MRFAWGQNPERVDLICPADLRTDVVRRRAIFHLSDAIRIAALLAREDLSELELEAAWSEDAELLCAALGTLGAERER